MFRSASTLKALGARIAGPGRAARNRLWARGARRGRPPEPVAPLPEPIPAGDAERGLALVGGVWPVRGHEIALAGRGVWEVAVSDPRLEDARQGWAWLDDLGALGTKAARLRAQDFAQVWVRRYGSGRGPGWQPEIAGLRAARWAGHAALLTRGLEAAAAGRLWRALAGQQHYLDRAWPQAALGLPRVRALVGLISTGRVLPHPRHEAAVAALGGLAEALIGSHGGLISRDPEALAEVLVLLVWAARMLEDAGEHATPAHLAAIGRGVPVLRQLRLGDGGMGRFHGGGPGSGERIDQALAELRLGVQPKPRLPMGYARLSGGRVVVLMDAASPPGGAHSARAHAGTLAFEMSVGRQRLVVNAGPGGRVAPRWAEAARQTAAHSTVEIDGTSSARLEAGGLAARTFGARLVAGPSLVSVRQAQDATGMWLLATHDGYVASHGLLHERRLFVEARGRELRGEEILTVIDARARAQFDRQAARHPSRAVPVAARFHLHPAIAAAPDPARSQVLLELPSGEIWAFRASGGRIGIEETLLFDPEASAPMPSRQVVVRAEAVEYLGQMTWSFARVAVAPPVARDPDPEAAAGSRPGGADA